MFDLPLSDKLRVMVAANQTRGEDHTAGACAWPQNIVHVGPSDLAALVRPGMRVTIAFPDATRACPDAQLIGLLLDELNKHGVNDADVTLLCATGLHRHMTDEERRAKLGDDILKRVRVVDHDAFDPKGLVRLGEVNGLPVVVNRLCVEADLLLATGTVEPHQYAGYSGGAKTIVIGCGGEATIKATHSPELLDHTGTRLGAVEGNPFQAFVRRAGMLAGLDYVVNVLLDTAGRVAVAAAGKPTRVHDYLVQQARMIYEVPVARRAHLALAGVKGPKACNLYQASRAATYLALARNTPLFTGAPILLPAAIPEGVGQGTGEQRFYEYLSGAASPAHLIAEMRRNGFPAGAQRAYILAQTLVKHPVIVVGAKHPQVVRRCHMHYARGIQSGLALAEELARANLHLDETRPLDFLFVPHALLTLPTLKEDHRDVARVA